METNKLILACLITLCSLPVAAQVKLGIEAGANLSNYITDSHSNPSDKISYANSSVRLGHYTSKEKAIKVLDMIQESCIDCHIDFQMPQDEEV